MLINCAAYQNGRKLADIPAEAIHTYLSKRDCFVWVALKDPSPAELAEMQKQFDLHPLAVEDATRGHQRPKIEEYGDSLFAVLHMLEPSGADLHVGEVCIFAASNYIVSVRRGAEHGLAEVRSRSEREPELLMFGSGYVLYALMDAVVDRYFPVIDALEDDLEKIEEQIFASQAGRANIEALYALKQRLGVVRHAVVPLLEGTGKLFGGRTPQICSALHDYFRDISDHLQRLAQSIETLRETVTTALSVNLSLITIQENEVVKRLASYAALVAVPTLIAGIYGMNFRHMPEIDWVWGYPVTLGVMAGIDAYLFYLFRKAKWL